MKLICINCPKGCHLEVEEVDGEVKVTGNSCPRGMTYAVSELKDPRRTLTTTVGIDSHTYDRLPLISSSPLPRDRIMDAMKALKGVETKAPVKMGEVIVKDILGLGIDMIASKTIKE